MYVCKHVHLSFQIILQVVLALSLLPLQGGRLNFSRLFSGVYVVNTEDSIIFNWVFHFF